MAVIRSRYKCKKDRRKKSKVKRWSKPRSMQKLVEPEFTVLPTRQTLTYAEAQKFVDVLNNGQVNRLNISDNIEILDSEEVIENIEGELSTNNNSHFHYDSNPSKLLFSKCSLINEDIPEQNTRAFKLPKHYVRTAALEEEENDEEEYDADEEDLAWLQLLNADRKEKKLLPLSMDTFEYVMDTFEKEAYNIMSIKSEVLGISDENNASLNKPSSGNIKTLMASNHPETCCICRESKTGVMNGLLKCDNCGLLVHQDCYGVPFQTEGIWLCKKCLKSPNSPVKCCLCPCSGRGSFGRVGGGAMKQTDDGRWVHILCALFIPEVTFGSNVYLEPVERISKVPQWRHQLRCSGCSRVGRGACLGCQAPGCVKAFHALCAIQKKCYLKIISTSLPSTTINGFKTKKGDDSENFKCFTSKRTGDRRTRIFYCYRHLHLAKNQSKHSYNSQLPSDNKEKIKLPLSSSNTNNEKVKPPSDKKLQRNASFELSYDGAYAQFKRYKPRKKPLTNEHPDHLDLPLSVPSLPHTYLNRISSSLSDRDSDHLVQQMHSYWRLKRSSRQGIPLVQKFYQMLLTKRRLCKQKSMMVSHTSSSLMDRVRYDWLKKWRRAYEKVRLLLELVRKREKMKLEMLKLKEVSYQMLTNPRNMLLQQVIRQLKSKDAQGWFHYPVTEIEAPGYHSIIKRPMSYEDMINKIDNHQYISFQQLRDDFDLIISNCLQYNQQGSVLHDLALKHQKQCGNILDTGEKVFTKSNYCIDTGLHSHEENTVDEAGEGCHDVKVDKVKNNHKGSKELLNFYSTHDMNVYIHSITNPGVPYKEPPPLHPMGDLGDVNNMAHNIRENRRIFNNKTYESSKHHKSSKKELLKGRKYGDLGAPRVSNKLLNDSPFQPTYESHKSMFKSRKSLVFNHRTTNTSNPSVCHATSMRDASDRVVLKDSMVTNKISSRKYNTTTQSSTSDSPAYDSAEDTIINSSDTPLIAAHKPHDLSKAGKSISGDEDTQNYDNDYDTQNDTELLSDVELNKTSDNDKTIPINNDDATMGAGVVRGGEVDKRDGDSSSIKSPDLHDGVVFYDAASEFAKPPDNDVTTRADDDVRWHADEASKNGGGNRYNRKHKKKHSKTKNKRRYSKGNVVILNGGVVRSVVSHGGVGEGGVGEGGVVNGDTTIESNGCLDDTTQNNINITNNTTHNNINITNDTRHNINNDTTHNNINSDTTHTNINNDTKNNIDNVTDVPQHAAWRSRRKWMMSHLDDVDFICQRIKDLERKISSSESIKYNYKFHIVKMCTKEIRRLKKKISSIKSRESNQKKGDDVHNNDDANKASNDDDDANNGGNAHHNGNDGGDNNNGDVVVGSNHASHIGLSTHHTSINSDNNAFNDDTIINTNEEEEVNHHGGNKNNDNEGNDDDNSNDAKHNNNNDDDRDNNKADGSNNKENKVENDVSGANEPDSTVDSSNGDVEGHESLRGDHARCETSPQRYHMRNHKNINKKITRSLCYYQVKQAANKYLLKKSVVNNGRSDDVKTASVDVVEEAGSRYIVSEKCDEGVVGSARVVDDNVNGNTDDKKENGGEESLNVSIDIPNQDKNTNVLKSSTKKNKKRKSAKSKTRKKSKTSATVHCGLFNDTSLVDATGCERDGSSEGGVVNPTHNVVPNGSPPGGSDGGIKDVSGKVSPVDEFSKKEEASKGAIKDGVDEEEEEVLEKRVTRSSLRSATTTSVIDNKMKHKKHNCTQDVVSNGDVSIRKSKRLNSSLFANPVVSLGARVDIENINISIDKDCTDDVKHTMEDAPSNDDIINRHDNHGDSTIVVGDGVEVGDGVVLKDDENVPSLQEKNENDERDTKVKDTMVVNGGDVIEGGLNGEVGDELNGEDTVVEDNEKTIACNDGGNDDEEEVVMRLMRKRRMQENTNTEPCTKKPTLATSAWKAGEEKSPDDVIQKGSVVWAKSRGYIWYPALVIYAPISSQPSANHLQSFDCLSPIRKLNNPSVDIPHSGTDQCLSPLLKCPRPNLLTSTPYSSRKSKLQNGHVDEVDSKKEESCINDAETATEGKYNNTENNSKLFLLRFYDKKRNWQWLERGKLVMLGVDEEADKRYLNTAKSCSSKKYLRRAYGIALKQLHRNPPVDDAVKDGLIKSINESERLPLVNGDVVKSDEVVEDSKDVEDKVMENRVCNIVDNVEGSLNHRITVVEQDGLGENVAESKESAQNDAVDRHERLDDGDSCGRGDAGSGGTSDLNKQVNNPHKDACEASKPSLQQPPNTQTTSNPLHLPTYDPPSSNHYDKSLVLENAISQMAPLFSNAGCVDSCTYLPKPQEHLSHYLEQLHKTGHFTSTHQYPSTEQFLNKRHHCLPHFPV